MIVPVPRVGQPPPTPVNKTPPLPAPQQTRSPTDILVVLSVRWCPSQGELEALKEQLRLKEEQRHATQQESSLLGAELRDASSTRDRSMADLYRMRLEADALRRDKADVQAPCARLERQLEQVKVQAQHEAVRSITTLIPCRASPVLE